MNAIKGIILGFQILSVLHFCHGEVEKDRAGKILSFFNIVTFPNDPCDAGTYNGTCYTKEECSAKGGTNDGSCASGYGVCCTFALGCGSTVSENNTYFVSSSTTSGACTLKICECSDNICQLRLDFDTFAITGPSTGSGATTDDGECAYGTFGSQGPGTCSAASQCLTDTFSVTNPGGPAPPVICGTNTGKHMYVDSNDACNELAFLLGTSAVDATTVSQSWSIRITQYACDYQNLAPSGCTEYLFGSSTGQISSYNFNNGNGYNLANQNQKICIRSEGTNCRICYSATQADVSFGGSTTTKKYTFQTKSCCTYDADGKGTTNRDCIIIPGLSKATGGSGAGLKFNAFCGGGCLATTQDTQKSTTTTKCKTICSTQQPFMITFNTDGLEASDEQKGVNQKDIGFRLSYIQSSSPC